MHADSCFQKINAVASQNILGAIDLQKWESTAHIFPKYCVDFEKMFRIATRVSNN